MLIHKAMTSQSKKAIIIYSTFSFSPHTARKTPEKARWPVSSFHGLNPEKPDVPLNKNDAFQKVQKRRVQEKR